MTNPTRQAQTLLTQARFGALAVTLEGAPYVARVAVVAQGGVPFTLISTLSHHTKALTDDPRCALLLGEPADKGDPLTHPRMTITATAKQVDKATHKAMWLAAIPKAKLYFDFTDFLMFRLNPEAVHLNAGFGKAATLTAADLVPAGQGTGAD